MKIDMTKYGTLPGDTPILINIEDRLNLVSIKELYKQGHIENKKKRSEYRRIENILVPSNGEWKELIGIQKTRNRGWLIAIQSEKKICIGLKNTAISSNNKFREIKELDIGDLLDDPYKFTYNEIEVNRTNIRYSQEEVKKAYCLGVFCKIGSILDDTSHLYIFQSSNLMVIESFITHIKELFSNTFKIDFRVKDRISEIYEIEIQGSELITDFFYQCIDKHINRKRVPKWIIDSKDLLIIEYFLLGIKNSVNQSYLDISTRSYLLAAGICFLIEKTNPGFYNINLKRDEEGKRLFRIRNKERKELKDIITCFRRVNNPQNLYSIYTEGESFVGGIGGCNINSI